MAREKLSHYEHVEHEGLWYAVKRGETLDVERDGPGQLSRTASGFALRYRLTGVLPPENSSAHPDYAARQERREQRKPVEVEEGGETHRLFKNIERSKYQTKAGEGQSVWWCNTCMTQFITQGKTRPEVCEAGHSADVAGIIN